MLDRKTEVSEWIKCTRGSIELHAEDCFEKDIALLKIDELMLYFEKLRFEERDAFVI